MIDWLVDFKNKKHAGAWRDIRRTGVSKIVMKGNVTPKKAKPKKGKGTENAAGALFVILLYSVFRLSSLSFSLFKCMCLAGRGRPLLVCLFVSSALKIYAEVGALLKIHVSRPPLDHSRLSISPSLPLIAS